MMQTIVLKTKPFVLSAKSMVLTVVCPETRKIIPRGTIAITSSRKHKSEFVKICRE